MNHTPENWNRIFNSYVVAQLTTHSMCNPEPKIRITDHTLDAHTAPKLPALAAEREEDIKRAG